MLGIFPATAVPCNRWLLCTPIAVNFDGAGGDLQISDRCGNGGSVTRPRQLMKDYGPHPGRPGECNETEETVGQTNGTEQQLLAH